MEQKTGSLEAMKKALGRLMTILQNADENKDGRISRTEFKAALAKVGNMLTEFFFL